MLRPTLTFLVAALILPVAVSANTPAPWLQGYSACLGEEGGREMVTVQQRLSKSEAKKIASKIIVACRKAVPDDFSGKALIKFEKSTQADLARRLQFSSRSE